MRMKLFLLLCGLICTLRCHANSVKVDELYRTLNISCTGKDELTKICRDARESYPHRTITCAKSSVIEEAKDECAVLYQLQTEGAVCNLISQNGIYALTSEWWPDNRPMISPSRLSVFLLKLKSSLMEEFSVKFDMSNKCFSATDILKSQGLSTKRCFSRSSVGQLCSAIVDRLTRGEYICGDEVFDDVSCVNDVMEQLFDLLGFDNDMLTLTELETLISDHHRSIREEDHNDHEDDHNDDHDNNHDDKDYHDGDHHDDHDVEDNNCISESRLVEEFNEVAEEVGLLDTVGSSCYQHTNNLTHENIMDDTNCSLVYNVCHDLILRTQLTTRACLDGNVSSTDDDDDHYHHHHHHHHHHDCISHLAAYGWGFLSTLIISIASQLGVITILFSFNNQVAKYLISLLIAVGVSSLTTDAILHLIPVAFGAHEDGGHGHDQTTIWRGVCVLAGILLFYMFEVILGIVKRKLEKRKESNRSSISSGSTLTSASNVPLHEVEKQPEDEEEQEHKTEQKSGCLNLQMDVHPPYYNPHQGFCHGISSIAWMIILGDGVHNFADGLAIGASFNSGGLGKGASTSLAILFHEVPHEFGDFAILLSSGMKWYVALMYNFLSAVVAIIGMFVGVGICHASEDAIPWILSFAAGLFLYVALVDLLPGLMEILNNCKNQKSYMIHIFSHMAGFIIGFVVLLLIAIYEEEINCLID